MKEGRNERGRTEGRYKERKRQRRKKGGMEEKCVKNTKFGAGGEGRAMEMSGGGWGAADGSGFNYLSQILSDGRQTKHNILRTLKLHFINCLLWKR